MKKPLLITTTLLVLALSATSIYAQVTTGTSIVDKMKAAAHSFTLSSVLNPTDTGLQSSPIKGKKTGDILTAGEWNRVLELVGQGGGSGESVYFTATHWGTSGFIANIPANSTSNAQGTIITNYTASQNDAMNKVTGIFTAPVAGYYVLNGHSNYFTTADANTFVQLISSAGKSVLGTRGAPSTMPMSEVTTIWYLNAGETVGLYLWNDKPSTNVYARFTGILINGGGGSSSSGGLALYKCTNAQSLDTTNAPCYGASRNGGAGTNQYRVVSCSNTDASGTYTAGGLLNFGDFIANKWSFHINNSNIACTDGSVLVMDIQGGGSGGGTGWENVPLTDTADYDTSCEYRFQLNKALVDGNWSFGSPTPAGNHYYYATYVANNIITASGTYNVMHGIPKGTKNKLFLYWVTGTGVDYSPSIYTTKIQKRCN